MELLSNNQETEQEQPETEPKLQPSNPSDLPQTDQEKRRVISEKFYTLSSSIKISVESLIQLTISSKKHYINVQPYFIVNERTEEIFMHELDNVNLHIGMASSVFDSYITFTKSQPDFTKFFNLFYQLHKFISNHRKSVFYMSNTRTGTIMYPFTTINSTLHSIHFLLSRLCGSLMVAGDYIQDQPPSAPSSYMGGMSEEGMYRPNAPYYPSSPYDWRSSIYNPNIEQERKRNKQRDIGDIDDKI